MRGVSEPNVWLYSSSWITTQELGLRAVFNETTHCVLLHSLSSFTLYYGRLTNTFHFHQHHVYHHPDSHHKQPHCTTKHAISSNSCSGHMISTNSYIC